MAMRTHPKASCTMPDKSIRACARCIEPEEAAAGAPPPPPPPMIDTPQRPVTPPPRPPVPTTPPLPPGPPPPSQAMPPLPLQPPLPPGPPPNQARPPLPPGLPPNLARPRSPPGPPPNWVMPPLPPGPPPPLPARLPPNPEALPTAALARPLPRARVMRRRSFPNAYFSTLTCPLKQARQAYKNTINLELRCYLTLMPFYCGHCYKLPLTPITGNCGHTSCRSCLRQRGFCSCGQVILVHNRGVNILVQNLIETLIVHPLVPPMTPVIATENSGPWMQKYLYRDWSEFPGQEVAPIRLPTRNISKAVARAWVAEQELDCSLCAQNYRRPITTPCGHTFCRTCLERALDYNDVCPLCKNNLHWFDIELIEETRFVTAAIAAADLPVPAVVKDRRLPIFACTIAYPMVSCPLFVFEPRYRLMLRRCLRGCRQFGMVAPWPNKCFAEYGTVLEIRDCVRLPNGCSLVSTMGISRFRVLEQTDKDGYNVAEVITVRDYEPRSLTTQRDYLQFLESLFMEWRNGIAEEDNAAIDATFGPMPTADQWTESDGPAFIWWVTAFLPLPENVKYSILKKTEVMQRMVMLQKCFQMMLKHRTRPKIQTMEPAVGPIHHIDID